MRNLFVFSSQKHKLHGKDGRVKTVFKMKMAKMIFLTVLLFTKGYAQLQTLDQLLGNALVEVLGNSSTPTQNEQTLTGQVGPSVNTGAFGIMSNTVEQTVLPAMLGTAPTSQGQVPLGLGSLSGSLGTALQTSNTRPLCTAQERRTLFNNCAMAFGMAHMNYFNLMARQGTCRVEYFSCSRVDDLVRCVNSQPVSVISNRCWQGVRNVLTGFLHQYRVPCSFEDLYAKCQTSSQDILPIDRRPRQGTGIDSNPMTSIMPMIMQYAMPMIMMFSGGAMMGF